MKNLLFRSKDRRKMMRNRSQDNSGTVGATTAIDPAIIERSIAVGPELSTPAPALPVANIASNSAAAAAAESKNSQSNNPDPAVNNSTTSLTSPTTVVQTSTVPRRSTLHRTQASLAHYRATPITKHYSLNNQILAAFEMEYEKKKYSIAYAIGLQFVETALLEIPKHGYFYSSRHAEERATNNSDAVRVSAMLADILEQEAMKRESGESNELGADLELELSKVKKLKALAVEQQSEPVREKYEEDRARVEAELNEMKKRKPSVTLFGDACGPLFDSFTETLCPAGGVLASSISECLDPKQHHQQQHQQASYQPPEPLLKQSLRDNETSTASAATSATASTSTSGSNNAPPMTQLPGERSVSSMMREIAHQQQPPTNKPDPPATSSSSLINASVHSSTSVPPPPKLDTGTWVMPEARPDIPDFGRQMSERTYADQLALERALYLSGLEVQPEYEYGGGGDHYHYDASYAGATAALHPRDPHQIGAVAVDDEQWLLEHALKESEREMKKLQEQEELQLFQACQASEQHEQRQQMEQMQQYQQHHLLHQQQQQKEQQQQGEVDGEVPPAPPLQRRVTKSRLQVETLHMLYHEDFVSLWNSGRIRITHVDTYQGKIPGSTNGCTVIAPLLCIHHFINTMGAVGVDDPGLPDETIKSVIDEEVPSILPKVREELGVVQDAFLIPSDSHDYLLKNQLLAQDQFVTVLGGNILDENHLTGLIRTLVDGTPPPDAHIGDDSSVMTGGGDSIKKSHSDDKTQHDDKAKNENGLKKKSPVLTDQDRKNRKIACTLFFHEHVISILKLRRAVDGKAWYDIIDSLPSRSMLSRDVGTGIGGGSTSDAFGFSLTDLEPPMNAARIRCLDEEALSMALKWYACSKFNAENLDYIDSYPWDDSSSDFDPRVFQAFVWTEAS